MKKILQKSCAWLVMLVAWFAVSMSAMAQNFTINASNSDNYEATRNGVTLSGGTFYYGYWADPSVTFTAPTGKKFTRLYITDNYQVTNVDANVGEMSNSYGFHTWTGEASVVTLTKNTPSTWIMSTIQVQLIDDVPADAITYTVNFTGDVPVGCSATLGDETISSNWSDAILKYFYENDLTVTTTEDYYAEVEYNEGTHTWTVAFKPWLVYTVEITIPSYNPNAVVEYQGDYYENGETIKSKTALTDSDFEAYDLNGYDESVTVEGNVVKVVYTESAAMEYHIVIENAPEGASVTVNGDQTFTESGSYFTPLVLESYHFSCNVPEGWYEDHTYNAGSRTYTVDFYEYTHYSVVVEGTEDAAAGVVYNWTTYHEGETLHGEGLTASSVSAASVSGLVGTVTLDGTTFTVTYTKPEYISIATNTGQYDYSDSENLVSVHGTYVYHSCLNIWSSNTVTITAANGYLIKKLELIENRGYTMSLGSDPAGIDGHVWQGTPVNSVKITCAGGDWDLGEVHVWLQEPEPTPAPEFPIQGKAYAIKNADANKYLNLVESADKGTVLGNAPEALYFTWDAMKAGFTITNEAGLYVGGHSNNWNMASNIAEYWTVEDAGTGLYYIKCFKGYMGVDETTVGSAAFRDKTFGDMIVYTLEDYVAPLSGTFAMSDAGWTTFCATESVEVPAGYTAYIVTAVDGETGTLTTQAIEAADETTSVTFDSDHNHDVVDGKLTDGTVTVDLDGVKFVSYYGEFAKESNDDGATITISAPEGTAITRVTFTPDGDFTLPTWPNGSTAMTYAPATATNSVSVAMGTYYSSVYFNGITVEYTVPGTKVVLPAYTGVLLEGPADGAVAFEQSYDTPNAVSGNLLVGCTENATWNTPGKTYYKFSLDADNTEGSAGFYWGVDGGASIEAHAGKAYLVLDTPVASNSRYLINGLGQTTGINTVATEGVEKVYNLQGQRVNATKAGVYVKNGKKFIVK